MSRLFVARPLLSGFFESAGMLLPQKAKMRLNRAATDYQYFTKPLGARGS